MKKNLSRRWGKEEGIFLGMLFRMVLKGVRNKEGNGVRQFIIFFEEP